MLENATSRAEFLENKMAALESESLESKVIQVLKHRHSRPLLTEATDLAQPRERSSWAVIADLIITNAVKEDIFKQSRSYLANGEACHLYFGEVLLVMTRTQQI